MAEPTQVSGGSIVISPDDPRRRRVWPDPRATAEARRKATYAPRSLTDDEIKQLGRAAMAYAAVFEASQREFLPTHAAIRAADVPEPEEG